MARGRAKRYEVCGFCDPTRAKGGTYLCVRHEQALREAIRKERIWRNLLQYLNSPRLS
jgi:hypothetical protein